jgi:hypothetical protein
VPFLCATVPSFRCGTFNEYQLGRRLEPSTIEAKIKLVKHLEKRFNLWDSE